MPAREPDPRLLALGRALRKARRDRDLSQEAVGQRAGMHANHVGTIERGAKDPRATTLLRLIEALEISPAELFSRYSANGGGSSGDGSGDAPPQRPSAA